VDYSEVAVRIGTEREREIFDIEDRGMKNDEREREHDPEVQEQRKTPDDVRSDKVDSTRSSRGPSSNLSMSPSPTKEKSHMRWSTTHLLQPSSLLSSCTPSSYSIIVDKSTSDSISCADDVDISLPYTIAYSAPPSLPPSTASSDEPHSPIPIHPVQLLALHLALVTKPGGRWISLSYSAERFATFLDCEEAPDDLDEIPPEVLDRGFPNPARLWRLERKESIEVTEEAKASGPASVGKPKIQHWVYVMVRTDVGLTHSFHL
jgi:hypothetical protein